MDVIVYRWERISVGYILSSMKGLKHSKVLQVFLDLAFQVGANTVETVSALL